MMLVIMIAIITIMKYTNKHCSNHRDTQILHDALLILLIIMILPVEVAIAVTVTFMSSYLIMTCRDVSSLTK